MKKHRSAAAVIRDRYLSILGLSGDPDAKDIQRAYRHKSKKMHPDLYPRQMRRRQQLMMMKLNEAYMALQNPQAAGTALEMEDGSPSVANQVITALKSKLPTESKDPGYGYYKTGFQYYTRAKGLLCNRPELKNTTLTTARSGDRGALKMALRALKEFEQAFTFFLKVIEEYPDSIWYSHSLEILEKIEKRNKLYNRICANITTRGSN